jgi:hypothetical protein
VSKASAVTSKAPATKSAAPVKKTDAPSKAAPAKKGKSPAEKPSGDSGVVIEKGAGKKRDGATHSKRGGRGGYSGSGRQFDRHSGRHADTDRKVKAGWGEGVDEVVGENDVKAERRAQDGEAATPVVVDKEEEAPVKTLEEYLAEKASLKAAERPALNIRKANEGVDASKWKAYVPLVKETEPETTTNATKSKKKESKPGKQILEIEQRFEQPPTSAPRPTRGGGRGGSSRGSSRGGSTRGSTRGSGRGGRGSSAPKGTGPNVSDPSSFPKLG